MRSHLVSISAMSRGCSAAREQKALIRDAVRATLAAEHVDKPCAIYVSTTDDAGIRELNRSHRDIDAATDVLSFPMFELLPGQPVAPGPWETECGRVLLGDIVISMERAVAQADEYGHSMEREVAFLTVHSVLHLLGYDHERGKSEEKLHFSRQEEILQLLAIKR